MPERYPIQPETKVRMKLPGVDGEPMSEDAEQLAATLALTSALGEQRIVFHDLARTIRVHFRWTWVFVAANAVLTIALATMILCYVM